MPARSSVNFWSSLRGQPWQVYLRRIGLAGLALAISGCASAHQQRLIRDSRRLGKAVQRGDAEKLEEAVLAGSRGRIDFDTLEDEQVAEIWGAALRRPIAARPEGLVSLGEGGRVPAVWTDAGWRFTEDPTDFYGQQTPRQALRSFVRATHHGRWDVLVELAPLRYRVGLSAQDLEAAWTEGEYAEQLEQARDRLERGLDGPVYLDSHEATLPLDEEHSARLELEGERWVVVDF